MSCLVISCSHRQQSNSARIAAYIVNSIDKNQGDKVASYFDLAANPLPLWQEQMWQEGSEVQRAVQPFVEAVTQADSLIWVVPEYAGMATPVAKNALLMLDNKSAAHKPSLLVTVSAGPAGSYPVAEMRMSSYKNSRLLWIPDHVIVRFADDFKEPFEERGQQQTNKRLQYSIKLLHEYSLAMKMLRQSGILAEQPYPFGV